MAIQLEDTERIEYQDSAAIDRFLEGESDARLGESPQSQDLAYLDGYLSALKDLILRNSMTLQIRWLSSAYVAKGFDDPNPF